MFYIRMIENGYLFAAGMSTILLALCHSILGETMIFGKLRKRMAKNKENPGPFLSDAKRAILWASWHLSSILGICIAFPLLAFSSSEGLPDSESFYFLINCLSLGMLGSSLLVATATKGRHPGWIVLLLIAILLQASIFS
ncbi:MAG: hypothetical protein KTR24_12675 [Saprospiraceae bacterium]|nr:hypothetical protein [Saprospiraceae bacterium]